MNRFVARGSALAGSVGVALMVCVPLQSAMAATGFSNPRPNPFLEISDGHTSSGVSQFVADSPTTSGDHLHFHNPTHVTQIASILVYSSPQQQFTDTGNDDGNGVDIYEPDDLNVDDEQYLGCVNVRLTPHSAVRLDIDDARAFALQRPAGPSNSVVLFGNNPDPRPAIQPTNLNQDDRYMFEIVTVPENPVPVQRRSPNYGALSLRIADGLGIYVRGPGGEAPHARLLHPRLFNLPEDPGQKQAAIDCMCDAASALKAQGGVQSVNQLWVDFGIICQQL